LFNIFQTWCKSCYNKVVIVDLHLRTKADLYSFMQCSFVKIQNLIGYVSEYMLMQPRATYKATYAVCRLFVRPNKKILGYSITLSQIFRGGRAFFFLNFYSFLNFLIVFFGEMGAVFPPYRWYFLYDVAKAVILL
jgi:hypothetical protein